MKVIDDSLTLLLHMMADKSVGLIQRAEILPLEQFSQAVKW